MADKLLRTTHLQDKFRTAAVLRIVIFFLLPLFYFLFAEGPVQRDLHPADYISGHGHQGYTSRRILALVDRFPRNCTPAAILEFPPDGLDRAQRKSGFIVVHCVLAVYCFLLLGTVCEQYFVPAIEIICTRLDMAADVAGATFMAAASSSPELFINCVGTFVTEGDLGVGAIVGSAVFNVLAVPACCALVAVKAERKKISKYLDSAHEVTVMWYVDSTIIVPIVVSANGPIAKSLYQQFKRLSLDGCVKSQIQKEDRLLGTYFVAGGTHWAIELDWWSVSRDCLMYAMAVLALILTLADNVVHWHEALLLVLMYTLYILAMVFNERLGKFVRSGCCYFNKRKPYTEFTPLLAKEKYVNGDAIHNAIQSDSEIHDMEQGILISKRNSTDSESSYNSHLSWPDKAVSGGRKAFWLCTLPISLLLWSTVPDCRRRPALYPLTFLLCIVWIGGVSYLVAWIITILGDTLDVPDSITGLTILAAGTSLPEAVSSVLVTNQGHGTMGISNSIGSNTFDILLCLGLPWLIKSLFYPSFPGKPWIIINSSGLTYNAISLLSTLFAFYVSLAMNKFQLNWRTGVTCALVYASFLVMASLIELNVLFVVNPPVCPH